MTTKVLGNIKWIVGCRIVQSVFALVVSILTARYLGPSNYGTINYAASLIAFITPFVFLGIDNVLVQEFIDSPQEEGEILGSAIGLCLISSFVCIIGVFLFLLVANSDEPETIIVCVLYSSMLFFQILDMFRYWFQFKYWSKYTAIIITVAYIIITLYKICLMIFKSNIYWFAVSNAFDYLLIAIGLCIFYYRLGGKKLGFSLKRAQKLYNKGKYFIISSLMVVVFAQTDKVMLKAIMGTEDVGFYSAAVYITGLTSFVFTAIIESMRPYIFEQRKRGSTDFEISISLAYSVVIYLAIAQSIFTTIFARPITLILYGQEYIKAITPLKIIVWYASFSYIGPIHSIWMLAENKEKYLWKINLIGALSNVVLNYCFIPFWGINGAAIASLITQLITNVVSPIFFKEIRAIDFMLIKALNIKLFSRYLLVVRSAKVKEL